MPAPPGLVPEMAEWAQIGTTWTPDHIKHSQQGVDVAQVDGERLLTGDMRGLNWHRPRMKDRAARRRDGYTRTGGQR